MMLKTIFSSREFSDRILKVVSDSFETFYMRYLCTQDKPDVKQTTDVDVWFPCHFTKITTTAGESGLLITPADTFGLGPSCALEIAIESFDHDKLTDYPFDEPVELLTDSEPPDTVAVKKKRVIKKVVREE